MKTLKSSQVIHQTPRRILYRGFYSTSEKPVIIKVLQEAFDTPANRLRFYNEYELTHDLSVPRVRKAIAKDTFEGQSALILEYVDGVSFRTEFIQNRKPIAEVLKVFIQLSETLHLLHQKNIIHKDINPNNLIFNTASKELWLIDFNISGKINIKQSALQKPEHLEGTLHYISPEQTGRMNRTVDYRSDLYSLGITFYEAFTGERPFDSQDPLELIHQQIARAAKPAHMVNPQLPVPISKIISKLIAKNAEDRYQSAGGLKADLEYCLEKLTTSGQVDDFKLAQHDQSLRFIIPEKLYGRSQQVAALLNSYEKSSIGSKEVLVISGSSGTGKSALVSEVYKPITKQAGIVMTGKFDQFQRHNPYYAINVAFNRFFQSILAESQTVLAEWKSTFLNALGNNAAVISELLPEIENIIGATPPIQKLGAAEAQNRLQFTFSKFLASIASQDHPLVLFIDDMQWADVASINLLQVCLAEPALSHVLFIFSYRNNEISVSHPFHQLLTRLSAQFDNDCISYISVGSLSEDDVNHIVADTLQRPTQEIAPLSALVYYKTGGNAFFVRQFLSSLYQEGALTYSSTNNHWEFDLEKADKLDISSNVIELMMRKVRRLPKVLQDILSIASCIGSTFNLNHLRAVQQKYSGNPLSEAIQTALVEGLVIPMDQNYQFIASPDLNVSVEVRFAHDKIQQTFHELLNKEEREATHIAIARFYHQTFSEEEKQNRLFDIANQYNEGLSLATDEDEKILIAEYLHQAASKAIQSSAYPQALTYSSHALELLNSSNLKEKKRGMIVKLQLEKAEALSLCGDIDDAKELFQAILKSTMDLEEKAAAYEKAIHFYTNIGEFKTAYNLGRTVLKSAFNVSLPLKASKPALIAQMISTRAKIGGRSMESILTLPEASEAAVQTPLRLLAAILKSAFQIQPELAVANSMTMVNMCLKHGNTSESAIGYLVFGGIFLGGILGDRKAGNEFGTLARNLNAKYNNLKQKSEVHFVYAYFAHSWLNPLTEAEDYFQLAYEYGLETGDIFHVGCACCGILQHQMMRGKPLNEIEKQASEYLVLLNQQKGNKENIGTILAIQQACRALQGKTNSLDAFSEEGIFDESAYRNEVKSYVSQHFAHYYFLNKMLVLYLTRNFEEANQYVEHSASLLEASSGMLHGAEHYFYAGLIALGSAIQQFSTAELKKLKKAHKKLKSYEKHNKFNFTCKRLILEAGLLHLSGQPWKALATYAQAREAATNNGFLHLSGIIHELESNLFQQSQRDKDIELHESLAIRYYKKWGYSKEISQEEQKEHSVEPTVTSTISYSKTISNSTTRSTDIDTIVKSTQILSEEVVLPKLLDKILRLVIENAGAQKGFLIMKSEEDAHWQLQASGAIDNPNIEVMQATPLTDLTGNTPNACISENIINYVIRTKQPVVVANAIEDERFASDLYIQEYQPQSVLCVPLAYKGTINSILYLENNLATDVFKPSRTEIIEILSSQVAISIANALAYENLENIIKLRTAEITQQKETIEKSNQNITASIRYAQRIQEAMLPKREEIAEHLSEHFILFIPKDIVSGDFYWFLHQKGKSIIAAIDCTGHGVPGAFMSLVGEALLTQIVQRDSIMEPDIILEKLHEGINRVLKQGSSDNKDGMDIALCVIDKSKGEISFAGATNPLVIVDDQQNLTLIKGDMISIGGRRRGAKKKKFQKHVMPIQANATYYIYSDGYQDQFGGSKNSKFMRKNFRELLASISQENLSTQEMTLEQKLYEWKKDQTQTDDILVIGFKC